MHTDLCEQFGIKYPIFAFTPSEHVAAAVSRAGGLGVLDLGDGDRSARAALARLRRAAPGVYGVRVGPRCRLSPADLAALREEGAL